jgi:AhpD family alkylhydroperoxidase
MATAHEVKAEVTHAGRELREAIPEVYAAYAAMKATTTDAEDGTLPPKVRELIAPAIAVSKQCDRCIAAHARSVAQRGASTQEVTEAIGVVILMNGGPATVWGPRAFAAFKEYRHGAP